MSSLIPLGGFQLPFQKRLSRLYNDTKKSSDFVKEPVQNAEDPDVKALHRKLRIQKDRLVTWGIEWSDPNTSAEIDESLSKAGLSEIVGSIMSTIKDILAEAEPLWQSYKGRQEGSGGGKSDKKMPLIVWDRGRFEDLVRDLTMSIDTLYDLSRTRSSAGMTSQATGSSFPKSADDFKPFESSRMQTPQQIDPHTLTSLRTMHGEPASTANERDIVFMSKQAYSDLARPGDRLPYAPLLVEFAAFDSIYSTTGIMPPMARFEKLSAGLQREPQRSPGTWTGLPRLLGYFEDMERSRLGLLYRFPPSFEAVCFDRGTQNPLSNLCTLGDLLARPDFEPRLEAKFRLAHNLANTVFDMHARGITHGNLIDTNIAFCDATRTESGAHTGEPDVRRPLVTSFDVFPDTPSDEAPAMLRALYRHPLDPHVTPQSPLVGRPDLRVLDLYSLAMVLLSVGLWSKVENFVPSPSTPSVPESVLEQLAIRCGTLYMKAVQACWRAVDDELAGKSSGEALLSSVQVHVSRCLEACCIIDGVSGLEGRAKDEPLPPLKEKSMSSLPSSSSMDLPKPVSKLQQFSEPHRQHAAGLEITKIEPPAEPKTTLEKPKKSEKLRLYPQVPIPQEAVEKWNKLVMPQINLALRQFYRKHPESVEISLESIGTTPQTTKPTVLVVCTSVAKVRSILSRKLADVFDPKSGFALKVCKGKVLRARKGSGNAARSMAGPGSSHEDGEETAARPHYQERPNNGASIGAWIGDRHLPPVSFGGLVMVDDKPYGMTVHHMLDNPDCDLPSKDDSQPILRSAYRDESGDESSEGDDYACEFSDSEDEYSETELTSDDGEEDEEDEGRDEGYDESDGGEGEFDQPGDIPGIEPGCGEGYIVTQPALDDVEEGFYPSLETEDEDHLLTYSLGEVYASSGIRRRSEGGLIHEIDWALFQFQDERRPKNNSIPQCTPGLQALQPTAVAPADSLPGTEVQCIARTSGLQTGRILPTLTSVKIYGRSSPSHTYQVASGPCAAAGAGAGDGTKPSKSRLGIPGDSGAWIIDSQQGNVCGHVLAWSQRKQVAYICPMEILMRDIAQTLEACEVKLPGGIAIKGPTSFLSRRIRDADEAGDSAYSEDEVDDEAPNLTGGSPGHAEEEEEAPQRSHDIQARFLSEKLEDMEIGNDKSIRVGV